MDVAIKIICEDKYGNIRTWVDDFNDIEIIKKNSQRMDGYKITEAYVRSEVDGNFVEYELKISDYVH
jgi:hypothetical protein